MSTLVKCKCHSYVMLLSQRQPCNCTIDNKSTGGCLHIVTTCVDICVCCIFMCRNGVWILLQCFLIFINLLSNFLKIWTYFVNYYFNNECHAHCQTTDLIESFLTCTEICVRCSELGKMPIILCKKHNKVTKTICNKDNGIHR